jgi:hypothetical protein
MIYLDFGFRILDFGFGFAEPCEIWPGQELCAISQGELALLGSDIFFLNPQSKIRIPQFS